MDRTTNLKELKNGVDFTWGKLIKIHEVGEYAIIEYHPWKVKSPEVLTGNPDMDKVEFHCYLNGRDIACSCESMDSALAYCIAYKHDGSNTRASYYFMKAIS